MRSFCSGGTRKSRAQGFEWDLWMCRLSKHMSVIEVKQALERGTVTNLQILLTGNKLVFF